MPELTDLYEILQVHPSAHPEVIQAAYRRLAQIYHPDRNPAADAATRMAEINRAYDILRDPQQRAAYDRQRAGGSNGMGVGAPVPDVVKAKSFQLVNDAGQTISELSMDRDGDPMLVMNDRAGKCRFVLYQMDGQVRLEFVDRNGNARLFLGESDDGRPMLQMVDRDGKRRFGLYQMENGQQWLEFDDRNGNTRLFVGESDDGTPMLYMTDRDGKRRFALYQMENGQQWLNFTDQSGDTRLFLGNEDNRPTLYMNALNGERRLMLYLNDAQGGEPTMLIDYVDVDFWD